MPYDRGEKVYGENPGNELCKCGFELTGVLMNTTSAMEAAEDDEWGAADDFVRRAESYLRRFESCAGEDMEITRDHLENVKEGIRKEDSSEARLAGAATLSNLIGDYCGVE